MMVRRVVVPSGNDSNAPGCAVRWAAGAVLAALGLLACHAAPAPVGASASDATGGESTASGTTTTAVDATTSEATALDPSTDDASSGAAVACPGNAANEPLCYQTFKVPWEGPALDPYAGQDALRVGNFGPDGEDALLLAADTGTPLALAIWRGDGFEKAAWGVVPDSITPGRRAVRFFDGVHADLLISDARSGLAIAPWTPDGPDVGVPAPQPLVGDSPHSFDHLRAVDVDGDGRDEVAISPPIDFGSLVRYGHVLLANVHGVPTYLGAGISHAGTCPGPLAGLDAGDLDGDGFVDFAAIAACGGDFADELAFSAEWGDGRGNFTSVGVPFESPTSCAWLGVADFDGDGIDDVVTAMGRLSGIPARVLVHRARGDRSFDPPVEIWNEDQTPGPDGPDAQDAGDDRDFILGDVDGDGTDDLVFRKSMLAVTQALATPTRIDMFEIQWKIGEIVVVSAFDFNHDGRIDFVVDDDLGGVYALISG